MIMRGSTAGPEELRDFSLRHLDDRLLLLLDARGTITTVAGAGGRLGGDGGPVGASLGSLYAPSLRRDGVPESHLAAAARDGTLRAVTTLVGTDDRPFPAEVVLERIGPDGATGFACMVVDISEKRRCEDILHERSEDREQLASVRAERDHLLGAVDNIREALIVLDAEWRIVLANDRASALLGTPRSDVQGLDFRRQLGGVGTRGLFDTIERAMREGAPVEVEEFYPLLGAWFEIRAYPTGRGAALLVGDVTERRRQHDRVARLAVLDADTALPNRLLIEDRLGQAVAHGRRFAQTVCVVMVDLHGIARIDEIHGPDAADEVIGRAARAMERVLRRNDSLGRIARTRFAAVQNGLRRF
ncbi:MAG TPA: diguanylate cyclase, partial [Longimicrobiales bacterium]|nr:diguanylate cyclase [Longimicrobiales bacterium]